MGRATPNYDLRQPHWRKCSTHDDLSGFTGGLDRPGAVADRMPGVFGTKLLRRLLPRGGVALRLRLQFQFLQIGALTLAVAEELVAAGLVLRRAVDRRRAVPGRRLHGERRI